MQSQSTGNLTSFSAWHIKTLSSTPKTHSIYPSFSYPLRVTNQTSRGWNGNEVQERMDICVLLADSRCCTLENCTTQHCKAIKSKI